MEIPSAEMDAQQIVYQQKLIGFAILLFGRINALDAEMESKNIQKPVTMAIMPMEMVVLLHVLLKLTLTVIPQEQIVMSAEMEFEIQQVLILNSVTTVMLFQEMDAIMFVK